MLKLCRNVTANNVLNHFSHKAICLNYSFQIFKCNQSLVPKRGDGFIVTQCRHINRFRPPPGVTPVDPKAIPFANQDLRPRTRGLALLCIPVLAFGLGTWQVQRLKWKNNLIANIQERTLMDPVPLKLPIEPEELAEMEFRKVTVTGTFDHDNEIYYGPKPCMVNGKPDLNVVSNTGERSYGFNLITPFVLSGSGERILVNRGWIQSKMVPPNQRPWSKTEGEQTITGVVRTTEIPKSFGPAKAPKYKVWHYRHIEDMAEKKDCLPIYIDATVEHSIPNLLWGGQTITTLRNEHLSYIITWYSLSIATGALWYTKYIKK